MYIRKAKTTIKCRGLAVSIPADLMLEKLSRLPVNSIGRFSCVSKLWGSMFRRPYVTELLSARPRLLLAVVRDGEWSFFSSPQPSDPYGNTSPVATAYFQMKLFSEDMIPYGCSYTSGLIYFPDMWISKISVPVICHPSTGQYAILPKLYSFRKSTSFLGFDRIGKQFKVLAEAYPFSDERVHHKVLTLGTGKLRWRSDIHCPAYDRSLSDGICINGVLYYLASTVCESSYVIVSFDVRSEKFKFIDASCFCDQYSYKLINYKGRLGGISWSYVGSTLELRMLILEDVEKHEWSRYVYSLGEKAIVDPKNVDIVGVTTATGEIVLCEKYRSSRPLCVFYFNPQKNTLQRVEIQGLEKNSKVYAFLDYAQDLNSNDAKQLLSSLVNQGLNISTERPKQ
ncbi:PREDICTED: F-box protein At3g57590-like [Camelina sativa]|uniref:F-box protein At3g57590-like n=1 Tax=Camelina sativa TaxID=90675 RepID=A0ABM0VYE5_CAMSA|nr:PREDICTED: F-box protein At3g57590-like [Camelina sativa]